MGSREEEQINHFDEKRTVAIPSDSTFASPTKSQH